MRSMDVSRYPDSLISYPRFPYHVPPACVLVRSCSFSCVSLLVPVWIVDSSPVTCLSSVSPSVSMTHLLTFLAYAFLLLCLDYSSAVSLFLNSSHTDDSLVYLRLVYLSRMFVLVSRQLLYIRVGDGMLPIFNLLCNHPKGVTCEIPRTLLVLSSSLAKATAS